MKNSLGDLHNHLFSQLERLNDESLKGDALKEEIVRSKAVSSVASQIIQNGNLVLSVNKFMDNKLDANIDLPKMLKE
jgi:hypothetical protein